MKRLLSRRENIAGQYRFAAAAAAAYLLVAIIGMAAKPQASQYGMVNQDAGHALFAIQSLLDGKIPYRDFFFNYGPLPLACAGLLAAGRDAPFGFYGSAAVWGSVGVFLLGLLLCRARGWRVAAAVLLLTGFAVGVGTQGQLYSGMERAGLLALALLWTPAPDRSHRRHVAVGLVFGLLQGVKFGGAFVAGAAWLATDFLWLLAHRAPRSAWLAWWRGNLAIGTAFLAVESCWLIAARAILGADHWLEFAFPIYILKWYAAYVHDVGTRWPNFADWRYFSGGQWPAIVGSIGALVAAAVFLVRGPTPVPTAAAAAGKLPARDRAEPRGMTANPAAWGIIFLTIFYLVGALVYFSHAMNMMVYSWLLLPGTAFALSCGRRWLALVVAASLLPSATLLPLTLYRQLSGWTKEPLVAGATGRMATMWMTGPEWAEFRDIEGILSHPPRQELAGGPVLFAELCGSGYHFHLRVPPATRQTWLDFPGAIPDAERPAALRDCQRAAALVCKLPSPQVPGSGDDLRAVLAARLPFDETSNRLLAEQFGDAARSPAGWLVLWRSAAPAAQD